ncbi:HNH endonuclease signature motif containing protein [Microbacterium allomyrinae]|uniref:HNH endonuclease n=1 Tax=Microbacterium allomyrinae TaxID=2830666 RepID=A0A9X1LXB7_9MICO|nr:HNH endonuclease signature motif containing protein [Microbacterium allomyrinae]MCC2033095.1 HNH endonuclease [Microbacterium allomyrinae]
MLTYFRAKARPEQLPAALTLDAHLVVDGDCWVYDGARNHNGYAIMSLGHKKVARAHRVAYAIAHGPIPFGFHIDHVWKAGCRSRACCNPRHLEAITQAENNRRAAEVRKLRTLTVQPVLAVAA